MAALQKFRGAFNGFNREDVVRYIELMNTQHALEVNQLGSQIKTLQEEAAENRGLLAQAAASEEALQQEKDRAQALEQDLEQEREHSAALAQELEQEKARTAALERELEIFRAQAGRPQTEEELEAYRRAERAERAANERVANMYAQASGILADATASTDDTAQRVGQLTQQICGQLEQLQETLTAGADTIRGSAQAMFALRPQTEEE